MKNLLVSGSVMVETSFTC